MTCLTCWGISSWYRPYSPSFSVFLKTFR
jgi:hypothetical protein